MVQCQNKECGMWRDLPMKYTHNAEQQQWSTTFKCSKIKLRGLTCRTPYEFRQEVYDIQPTDNRAKGYDQDELLGSGRIRTRNQHNLGNKDGNSSTLKNTATEILEDNSQNTGLGGVEVGRMTRRREAKRLMKEQNGSNSNEDI